MKKIFIIVASFSLMAYSVSAEQVRVVVSQDKAVNSIAKSVKSLASTVQSKTICLKTTDGLREICVPKPSFKMSLNMTQSASTKEVTERTIQEFTNITVDADSVSQVVDTLNSTGWYNSVEVDVVVSSITSTPRLAYTGNVVTAQSNEVPNDPEYHSQTYLHSESVGDEKRIHSNITKASNTVINKEVNVGIAVLDSGFAENDELQFTSGFSFVTSHDAVRNEHFGLSEGQDPLACGMHGYGVASVMTTAIDDGQTLAGVINGVDTYALRVMNCGLGYLSDTAAALNYIAKQEVLDAPLFTGNVQVANLSLSGYSDECPQYIQSAIDNANEAGITVVVAAGNNNIDASKYTPGNCYGVVTVGAVSNKGNRSSFSNHGDSVSISAQGEDILGFGYEDKNVYWWEGTSFSSPLVAASIALAKRDAQSLPPSTMRWLVQNTVSKLPDDTGECETMGCGTGLLDANALVLAAQKAEQGDLSSIHHALSDKSTCDQQWYIDHFGESAKLCSMYRVNFFDGLVNNNIAFKLIRAVKGHNLNTGEEILTSEASFALLQDIDTTTYDYGFKTCQDDVCSVDIYSFLINEEKMASPTACE